MIRRMWSLFVVVALAYAAFVLFLWATQDRLVYFPVRELATTPRAQGIAYDEVWLATDDGVRLHAWFIPAPGARTTLLYLHGNGGNISHRLDRIELFRRLGVNVFIVDYRGYGLSPGTPSEDGTYRDARAAARYLAQTRGIASSAIVIYGESLGAAVAARLASEQAPRALIVESAFTSVPDLGAEVYWWLPVRWLSRFRYPTAENIAQVNAPVLVVHSREDEIVPFRHGERLYATARGPKQFLELRGGHNDGFIVSRAVYVEGLDRFLREYVRD